jgi:hypothetical protein
VTKNHYTPEELPKIGVFVKRGLLILLKNISFGGGEGGRIIPQLDHFH